MRGALPVSSLQHTQHFTNTVFPSRYDPLTPGHTSPSSHTLCFPPLTSALSHPSPAACSTELYHLKIEIIAEKGCDTVDGRVGTAF